MKVYTSGTKCLAAAIASASHSTINRQWSEMNVPGPIYQVTPIVYDSKEIWLYG